MRYDNSKITAFIDSRVDRLVDYEDIYVNHRSWYYNVDCWTFWLVMDIYYSLPRVNGFLNAKAAVSFIAGRRGNGSYWYKNPGSNYYTVVLPNTTWYISKQYRCFESLCDRMSAKLGTQYGEEMIIDSRLSAESILAIDYHFPYILERAKDVRREYQKILLAKRIEAVSEESRIVDSQR